MVAQVGDEVYLGSRVVNTHFYGIVGDFDTPAATTATMEMSGDNAAISLDALVGPPGNPGQPSPIVRMQYGSSIDDPEDLPDYLTDTPEDIGKAWWIDNLVYMWDGEHYVMKQMGTVGPPGPVPDIDPTVESIPWVDQQAGKQSEVIVTGTAANPGWHFKIAAPRGPQGENATIRDATDYDDSDAPTTGQVIAWDGENYKPVDANPIAARMFTVPEAAFTSYTGMTQRQTIATFVLPAQPFDYVPHITGHLRAHGLELDEDPLIIGSEVRIDDPIAGTIVARGFGNNSTWTTIVPHFSTPSTASDAVTPDNGVARIQGGMQATVYVNLYNDGVLGSYVFNKKNAQLTILIVPV